MRLARSPLARAQVEFEVTKPCALFDPMRGAAEIRVQQRAGPVYYPLKQGPFDLSGVSFDLVGFARGDGCPGCIDSQWRRQGAVVERSSERVDRRWTVAILSR